jgi:hypothetical protein
MELNTFLESNSFPATQTTVDFMEPGGSFRSSDYFESDESGPALVTLNLL